MIWDWQAHHSPPVRSLQPVRETLASRHARHIPVTAYSVSNDDHVWLESGLEHDLLRKCDRDRRVKWLVSQPFRLSWGGSTPGHHTPDLLSLSDGDTVTVWDARRLDEEDQEFMVRADVTRQCCEAVGWHYELFNGLTTVERLNLLWLHGFRRRPDWLPQHIELIRCAAGGGGTSLGSLFTYDDGSGELKSVVWHTTIEKMLHVTTVTTKTRRRRGEVFERALCEATLAELAEVGYGRLSMLGVAARACTGKAALYRRFKSKHDLVRAALDAVLPPLPELGPYRSARQALLTTLVTHCDLLAGKTAFPNVEVVRQFVHEPELRAIYAEGVVAPCVKVIESILRAAVEAGEIAPVRVTPLTAWAGPALISQHFLMTGRPPSRRELALVVDTVMGR